jgi:hypothetical protein
MVSSPRIGNKTNKQLIHSFPILQKTTEVCEECILWESCDNIIPKLVNLQLLIFKTGKTKKLLHHKEMYHKSTFRQHILHPAHQSHSLTSNSFLQVLILAVYCVFIDCDNLQQGSTNFGCLVTMAPRISEARLIHLHFLNPSSTMLFY